MFSLPAEAASPGTPGHRGLPLPAEGEGLFRSLLQG